MNDWLADHRLLLGKNRAHPDDKTRTIWEVVIEANISTLKRSYGMKRCTWSGWEGFKACMWSAIVAYNLNVLARIQLAKA